MEDGVQVGAGMIRINPCRNLPFVVDDAIDLRSHALLDMISAEALVAEAIEPEGPQTRSQGGKGFKDIDWEAV